jgi:hypothetical protein
MGITWAVRRDERPAARRPTYLSPSSLSVGWPRGIHLRCSSASIVRASAQRGCWRWHAGGRGSGLWCIGDSPTGPVARFEIALWRVPAAATGMALVVVARAERPQRTTLLESLFLSHPAPSSVILLFFLCLRPVVVDLSLFLYCCSPRERTAGPRSIALAAHIHSLVQRQPGA